MKIGIDTFGCDHGRSGIGSYILSLAHNMPQTEHTIEFFGPELDKYTYISGLEGISYTGISINDSQFAENLWHIRSFNAFATKRKYDMVLFPAGLTALPLRCKVPAVAVMQSSIEDTLPSSHPALSLLLAKLRLASVKGIICPTKYIKNSLLSVGILEAKIKVIPNGIDTSLFYPHTKQHTTPLHIQPFAIQQPYIIYASRISHPAKCHIELITAFALFKQKTKAPHRLVIAGAPGKGAEYIHHAVLNSPVCTDILLTGYFPHQHLPQLYAAAELCIFPSTAEGVGLSVIEAMACGIPTACAHAGALPEIAGPCTYYFDPQNPQEIAQAIENLIKDPLHKNSDRRKKIINKGIAWVTKYRWQDTTQQTLTYITALSQK
ncbi:MAG: glycosyltransferase family 4 protein [Treponema sp.]